VDDQKYEAIRFTRSEVIQSKGGENSWLKKMTGTHTLIKKRQKTILSPDFSLFKWLFK
jgi:hypothetical protein